MKKLMIAAVAAIFGVAANAAKCEWSVDTIYESSGSGDNATGYLVYYVDSVVSASTIGSQIEAGNFTLLNAAGYEADGTTDDGYASGSGATYTDSAKAEYGNSYTPNAYLVILDASTQGAATHYYISDAIDADDPTTEIGGAAAMSFGDLDDTFDADNWIAIPEPTSGLLLLIGMAGLALRRRRA